MYIFASSGTLQFRNNTAWDRRATHYFSMLNGAVAACNPTLHAAGVAGAVFGADGAIRVVLVLVVLVLMVMMVVVVVVVVLFPPIHKILT